MTYAGTARSREYLAERLNSEGPDLLGATTLLSRNALDLLLSLPSLAEVPANYDFAAQYVDVIASGVHDPFRRLTAGVSATVKFSRVPDGVNGNDTAHYLYIVDSLGTSEAVLITGGSGRSSDKNGQITFTPAFSHSGSAWYIESASDGMIEAATAHPTQLIRLPGGYTHVYAKPVLPAGHPGVIGNGFLQSLLGVHFTDTAIFEVTTNAVAVTFDGFSFIPLSGNMTAGAAIDVTATSANVTARNLFIGASGGSLSVYIGVRCVGPSANRMVVNDCWILAEFRGLDIEVAYFSISNVQVLSERTKDNYILTGAALYVKSIAGAMLDGFIHDGGVFQYGWLADVASTFVNELQVTNLYLDNWITAGIIVSGTGAAASWEISSFRIVDDNGLFANGVAGSGMILNGSVINWQVGNGSINYAYGYGVQVTGSAVSVHFSNVQNGPHFTSVGNAALVVNGGSPTHLSWVGGSLGSSVDGGVTTTTFGFVSNRAIDHLVLKTMVDGSTQANKIVLGGTETNVSIDCEGIGNVRKTVAAAATLTFPVMNDHDVIEITGSTALATAVAGLREGQSGVMKWTDAAPGAVSQVATIQSAGFTPTRYKPYPFMFSNGVLNVG